MVILLPVRDLRFVSDPAPDDGANGGAGDPSIGGCQDVRDFFFDMVLGTGGGWSFAARRHGCAGV